jgi:hypothetical protein
MPWGRLDDDLNDDPKLSALTDSAFRLWVAGLVYCNKHLTDGFIPESEVQYFRLKAKNRAPLVAELCTPQTSLGKGPLWHKVENGYTMHDYLDWNDSRDKVMADRAKARERLDRHRGKRNYPRVMRAQMDAICNAVSDALREPFTMPHDPASVQVSTYHVPQNEKQERAPGGAGGSLDDVETRMLVAQHRRQRSRETVNGKPAIRVIAALARHLMADYPALADDEGELMERVKQACARANLDYSGAVGPAIDRARAQLANRARVSA